MSYPSNLKQRGVAVVTALLLTTLAVTIVASVFWQQQVQVRAVENQRSQSQTQWVLRAALDWTRIILRDDARTTVVDQLGEKWAIPLVDARLDDYIENDHGDSEVRNGTLSGSVIDAQSRYNLSNLAVDGVINPQEVLVYQRLLGFLGINPSLAAATAKAVLATQPPSAPPSAPPPTTGPPLKPPPNPDAPPVPDAPTAGTSSQDQRALFIHNEDLMTIPGYTPAIIDKLKNYVVILPKPTPINVNTTSTEVLAAKTNLSMEKATALVASRAHAYFLDTMDFQNRAQLAAPLGDADIAVSTNFFLVFNKVQWERANVDMQALIYRKRTGNTTVMWLRE
ncbi:MAG TPA: type II secretion system minor pseudopilin GspK [Burkholderiaceae bacterium]|jgi:general secretion pathway protein K|nr:type II secretion system minor pseudopilin GspK [Burkholderiaceae bacterium]